VPSPSLSLPSGIIATGIVGDASLYHNKAGLASSKVYEERYHFFSLCHRWHFGGQSAVVAFFLAALGSEGNGENSSSSGSNEYSLLTLFLPVVSQSRDNNY
jgi:hypothetical protein